MPYLQRNLLASQPEAVCSSPNFLLIGGFWFVLVPCNNSSCTLGRRPQRAVSPLTARDLRGGPLGICRALVSRCFSHALLLVDRCRSIALLSESSRIMFQIYLRETGINTFPKTLPRLVQGKWQRNSWAKWITIILWLSHLLQASIIYISTEISPTNMFPIKCKALGPFPRQKLGLTPVKHNRKMTKPLLDSK